MEKASQQERSAFSERLQHAMRGADYPVSPSRLVREFNARFTGAPVTVHAARKWLMGEAIPTQEKVRLLSHWLGVSPDWLRFGGPEGGQCAGTPAQRIQSDDLLLLADLKHLDAHHRHIVREFVRMMVREQGDA